MRFAGKTALITGAAGGIGRALALDLWERGAHLALVDVDADGLARVGAALAAGRRQKVSLHVVDVADREGVHALPGAVVAEHGGLDLLINNAGVALGGSFEETAEEDFEWLLSVNLIGLTRMTRAFLPLLRARPGARIVNLSSLFGIIAPPGQTAYAASKYAVRGFSDALRHELAGTGVGVTCVHPGGVATSIATSARVPRHIDQETAQRRARAFAKLLRMPPARAAAIILAGIAREKPRIIVGSDARLAIFIERLLPVHYWALIGRGARPDAEGSR